MAEYRFIACDAVSGEMLGLLPLSDVRYEGKLNDTGALTASLGLDNRATLNQVKIDSSQPKRTAIYVERDGVIVWGGMIWNRTYDSGSHDLKISAADWWSYWKHRYIVSTLSYSSTDQHAIASGIFAHGSGQGGSPSFSQSHSLSGVTRDRTYYYYEKKELAEAIEQLSAVEGGFDFAIGSAWSAGSIVNTFRTWYPHRGSDFSANRFSFDWGRNLLAYKYPEDGARAANRVHACGEGEGVNMLLYTASRSDRIDYGDPLLEMVKNWRDVKESATLIAHATGEVNARADDIVIPQIEIAPDQWPEFGSWQIGDEVRVTLGVDPRFPTRTSLLRRIIAYSMSVGNNGGESLSLTLGESV